MTTLVDTQLLTYENGRSEIYATWKDEVGTFAAIHDTEGRALVSPEGIHAPKLDAEQVAAALTPPVSPAHALATKGAASRPDLAERMSKAAELVDGGAVRLISQDEALVNGYEIDAETCTCKDFEHRAPDGWCKHRLAVRMARALGQGIEAESEAEKEAAARERVNADKAATAQRVYEGKRKVDQEWKQARRDGDGARRWMLSHMAHNGNAPIPADIYRRATGAGREEELARVKAEVLAMTPEQHLTRYDEIAARQECTL